MTGCACHYLQAPDMRRVEVGNYAHEQQLVADLRAGIACGSCQRPAEGSALVPHRRVLGEGERAGQQLLVLLVGHGRVKEFNELLRRPSPVLVGCVQDHLDAVPQTARVHRCKYAVESGQYKNARSRRSSTSSRARVTSESGSDNHDELAGQLVPGLSIIAHPPSISGTSDRRGDQHPA